jgi:C-terminal processing protease CtpA/Prc
VDLESGQTTQLTRDPAGDDDPSFSPDGRFIAFDSAREGSQAIYIMNADGTNVRRVSQDPGFLQVPAFSPDGRLLVYETMSPMTGRSGGLFVVSASGGPSMRISRDGRTACWSPTGDYIYFTEDRGPRGNGIWRVRAPKNVARGELVPFIGHVEVDRKKELGELFDEAWNALKDGFYSEKRIGKDKGKWWASIKTKYRTMAIDTENKDEFQSVIRQLLAELGASHLGIFGGQRPGNHVTPAAKQNGYFGFDLAQEPAEDGSRRVTAIVPGSPADKAGMRVGDVVTKIHNTKLRKKTNLNKATLGLVEKEVKIAFKPRTETGVGQERTVAVQGLAIRQVWDLKYEAWIADRARRVKEATKKEKWDLGYVHLRSMNPKNLQKFQQAVTRWNRSKKIKGMVLDVRNNGGGNIHIPLMSVLTSKPLARVKVRGREEVIQPGLYWDKPVVLLINERSFSDAEVFPFMFKEAGLGKVVGVPTPGGVIGTTSVTLSDGSQFRVPRTGFKTMDGVDLEGLGVKPDVLIEETTEDRLNDRDPQLNKALEIVMAEARELVKAEAEKKKAKKKKKADAEPAEKKKVEPEEQPVKPEAIPASATHPLEDVEVGEWVRYRVLDPGSGEETVLKVSVTRIENGVVHFGKEIEKGGIAIVPLPEKMKRGSVLDVLPTFGQLISHAVVEGEVRDARASILIAQVRWPDGSDLKLSFTNAIPAYGLWRVEIGKLVILEALDWGKAEIEKPDTVAAEEPEPAPKAEPKPEAAADKPPVHPIFDAKEGEWVKIRRFGPQGQSADMVIRVTEVTDDEVAFEQTAILRGREIKGPTVRRERKKELTPPENLELKGYGKETIKVGEQNLECVVMKVEDASGAEMKLYFSNTVPFNGLARMERDGEVVMEAVEWGDE